MTTRRFLPAAGAVRHFAFWLAASILLLLDFETQARASGAFALGVALVALAAASAARRATGKALYFAAAIIFLGLASLYGTYLRTVGPLRSDTVRAIAQTDLREAAGYLLTQISPMWAPIWLLLCLLLWLTFPHRKEALPRPAALLAVAATGFLLLLAGRAVVTEPLVAVRSYQEGMRALAEASLERRLRPLPSIASDFEGNVILILGESVSRHHMSLHGYPRRTTPLLDRLAGEMAVFGDVISAHSTTVSSLLAALKLPAPRPQADRPDLLELARAAGFETHWLSNQNEFGIWDNPVRILAAEADFVRYHDGGAGKAMRRELHDEAMLPSLDRALRRPASRKLIILHMISAHAPYCWTRPERFNALKDDHGPKLTGGYRSSPLLRLIDRMRRRGSGLDCYDNSLRHVDWIAAQVIARARRLTGPAAVIFVSDHGEAPLLGTGHEPQLHSAYHIEVPLLVWGNRAFRRRHGDKWTELMANRQRPFSLALLTPTLADLMMLETPLVRREDSLFSRHYRERERTALNGRVRYDRRSPGNDYRENARLFVKELGPEGRRVWAHRVNSLGALLEAKRLFSGSRWTSCSTRRAAPSASTIRPLPTRA